MRTAPLAAWPLPLLGGLLPLIGTLAAFGLSVQLGLVEACNPLFDGCVSISRAGRHGLPNHLFRALLLPAAVLQALTWLLCGVWLRTLDSAHRRRVRALPWLGLIAALFLVLYGTFLGTEGDAYRWMRRFGVVFYFSATCLAMLVATGALQTTRLRAHHAVRALLFLSLALPLLGGVNAAVAPMLLDPAARDALQNRMEWWGGLAFTLFFFALAWLWRATRFELGAT